MAELVRPLLPVRPEDPLPWCGATLGLPPVWDPDNNGTQIQATWTVPHQLVVPPGSSGAFRCASWVGIGDGRIGGSLFRAGILSEIGTGGDTIQRALAWVESSGPIDPLPFTTIDVAIDPGDLVTLSAQVGVDEAIPQWDTTCFNLTTKRQNSRGAVMSQPYPTAQAAWIVERTAVGSQVVDEVPPDQLEILPDFGTVTFGQCQVLQFNASPVGVARATTYDMLSVVGPRHVLSEAEIVGDSQVVCRWKDYR
jgi:hypothetical protein